MKLFATLCLAALVGSAAQAGSLGQPPSAAELRAAARPTQTFQSLQQLENWVAPDDLYSGVGGLYIETAGSGSICTGSLIGPSLVLTAAHCLTTDAADPVQSISFFLPGYLNAAGDRRGRTVLEASSFRLHDNWTGEVFGGYDLAVVKLSDKAPIDRDIYGLNGAKGELGNDSYNKIGTGTIGLAATGTFEDGSEFDGRKRVGLNRYDMMWSDVIAPFGFGCSGGVDGFGAPCDGMLAFDMDDGIAAHDVFGRFFGIADSGRLIDGELVEANSSGGDSGGPTFIDGRIAGITSFGISGNIFEPGDCGVGSVDPSAGSDGGCTNSSAGEISVDARVGAYLDWLNPFIDEQVQLHGEFAIAEPAFYAVRAATVPLPGSLALVLGALLAIGVGRRRAALR